MWDFKNANFDLFREELSKADWDSCLESDDINVVCERWSDLFMNISEQVIRKKRVKVRPQDKNWYNNYLRRLKRFKDREHGIWVQNKSELQWDIYKAARNTYFQECDRLKLEYEEHIYASLATEITKNPKKWWSLVGQTMNSSKKSNYPTMIQDGVIYATDKEKADIFNSTYLESSNLAGDHFELPDDEHVLGHEPLEEIIIQEKEVDDILQGIDVNKAYGPDNISPRLIKEARPSIIKILTNIFNRSLHLSRFPLIWKRANVLPIYKKAEAFFTINYRPVSLLSILAKVFEKIVFKHMFNYFRDHFLISVWQSGFLPGSSTVTQLTEIYHQFCKAVSNGKEIRVVFLDISKAFDRVWHRGLLFKLRKCGISGRLLDWLKDYLTDREQRVIINGEFSEWGKVNAGVPQGSVLGPLLFLIFINDITEVIKNCKIRLFADDTCLFIEVEEPEPSAMALNEDLENLNQWASKWHVNFSPPKTEEVLISNKRNKVDHPPAFLNGVPIKRVASHKHLGLVIASDLTWKEQIAEVVDKANRRLGIMRTLKFKLDRLSLERIYKGFIRPLLEYGDIVWDSPSEVLNSLEAVQLNAARIVVGATARCSTQGLYNETKWEPLSNRREHHRLTLMFKILNGKAPSYLADLVPNLVQDRTGYLLRNRGHIDIPFARLLVFANSFFPRTVAMWNDLNRATQNLPSVEAFKASFSRALPKQDPLVYFGGRLESAIHTRMRISNSPLKADLCQSLHVIESPLCPCGSGANETADHFFFHCNNYQVLRGQLKLDLEPLIIDNVEYLLHGIPGSDHSSNIHVFTAVHKYIRESRRFY
jgi:hypothetical protein